MTDQRLRDLLEEQVADATTVDLVSDAWEGASVVRRRRRATVGAAVAVAAVIGATVAVVTGGRGDAPPPPPASQTTDQGPVPKAERGGKYAGVPVWWAPSTADEADLPALDGTALPPEIDLATETPVPAGIRAVGLFQLWGEEPGRVVVVGADGTSYSLEVGFGPVTDEEGNESPPVTRESLSPDGRYAFFAQDRSLEVYDFEDATWTSIGTRGYAAERAIWVGGGSAIRVPAEFSFDPEYRFFEPTGVDLGNSALLDPSVVYGGPRVRDEFYGPIKRSDGSGGRGLVLAGPVTDPDGVAVSSVDAFGAGGESEPEALLAMRGEQEGRWNQCCPAVGWFDPSTVLFESRHADARILAWRIGTDDVYRVSDIRGWTAGEESYVASFAALDGSVSEESSEAPIDPVTAERGPAYGGARIWWAPPAEDESSLPALGVSPLPSTIDLSDGLPAVPAGTRAKAVFKLGDRAVALTEESTSYSLGIGRLDRVTDESGNVLDALGEVSPDGRHVFFFQRSALEVYDFEAGAWTTIETPAWLAEGARWLGNRRIWVPDVLGQETGTAYSLKGGSEPATYREVGGLWDAPGVQETLPAVVNDFFSPTPGPVAQQYVVAEAMTGADGRAVSGVNVLHVDSGVALAIPMVDGERGMGCCQVIDWLDQTQLLYWSASQSAGLRILAWDVGSEGMTRVAEISGVEPGEPVGSSFADLS